MELQGSNMFGGARPQPQQAQQFQQQQQQTLPPAPGGHEYISSDGGYQTEDIFGGQRNSFLETLRSLALNPSQLNSLFQGNGVTPGQGLNSSPYETRLFYTKKY